MEPSAAQQLPGRYELIAEIARGGMGAIWKVRDTNLNRTLALKMIRTDRNSDDPAIERFRREAQITGRLQHPCIPPVVEQGLLDENTPFFSMRLIEGQTLAELLQEIHAEPERLAQELPRLLTIFEQVCQAIGYAHSENVLHRDLKPHNIMLGQFGEVQVLDWGMARWAHETATSFDPEGSTTDFSADDLHGSGISGETFPAGESITLTVAGQVLGTLAYMPPEQARGAHDNIATQADVFGLGGILLKILTNAAPYRGASAKEVYRRALTGEMSEAITLLEDGVHEAELVALVNDCLAQDPAARPQDGKAVAARVREFQQSLTKRLEAEKSERRAAEVRIVEQRKRKWTQAFAVLCLLTVAAAGTGFAWWYDHEANRVALTLEKANRQLAVDEANIRAAIKDAAARQEEAWSLTDEPAKMRAVASLAVAAANRAKKIAEGNELPPALRRRLDAQLAGVATLDRNATLLVEADDALQSYTTQDAKKKDGMSRGMEAAFGKFGWKVYEDPPGEVAAEIASSPLRNKLLGLLWNWWLQHPTAQTAKKTWLANVNRQARLLSGGIIARWQRIVDAREYDKLVSLAREEEFLNLGAEIPLAIAFQIRYHVSYEAVLPIVRRIAQAYPQHVWANFDAGFVAGRLQEESNNVEVVRYYAAAAAVRPRNAFIRLVLGESLYKAKEYAASIEAFREASRLSPDDKNALNRMGFAIRALRKEADQARSDKNYLVAERKYRFLLEQDRRRASSWRDLAGVLASQGKNAEAEATAKRALLLDDSDLYTVYTYGRALKNQKKYEAAIAFLKTQVTAHPDHWNLRVLLADTYTSSSRFDEALEAYQRAQAIRPYHKVNDMIAMIQFMKGRTAEAKKTLLSIMEDSSLSAEERPEQFAASLFRTGTLLGNRKEYAAAEICFKALVKVQPEVALNWDWLGFVQYHLDRDEEAIVSHRKAYDIEPSTQIRRNLARCYLRQKEYKKALPFLQVAVKDEPRDLHLLWMLGDAYFYTADFRNYQRTTARFAGVTTSTVDRMKARRNERLAQSFIDAMKKLPRVLQGGDATDTELAFMHTALLFQKRYAAMLTIGRKHMQQTPLPHAGIRYNTACAALLLSADAETDFTNLPLKDAAALRAYALQLLREEFRSIVLGREYLLPEFNIPKGERFALWSKDPDLASIRGAAIDALPEKEQPGWREFWKQVQELTPEEQPAA